MIPPGKTTLARMQRTAMLEAERIEISQDGRVHEKMLDEPMPCQVLLRDDFAGIVRLIDIIMSDRVLMERLQERMAAMNSLPPRSGGEGRVGGASAGAAVEIPPTPDPSPPLASLAGGGEQQDLALVYDTEVDAE